MHACRGCGATVGVWFGDAWCDDCGGVMARPGVLLMRHIGTASVNGKEVRIVHDISTGAYKFRCERVNPRYEEFLKGGGTVLDEDWIPTPVLTQWSVSLGDLLPMLEKEFGAVSSFDAAKTATEDERKTLER